MQQRNQIAWFIISIFLVMGVLGGLSAVALPHAGEMAYESVATRRETEKLRIEAAVREMLNDSLCGELEPVGFVTDLGQVLTRDNSPLVLADYLPHDMSEYVTSGYYYSFTSDGIVLQFEE